MNRTTLTPDAKEALRRAIRALRPQLLEQIGDATRSAYRLDVAADRAQLPEARRCRRERLEGWIAEQARAASGGAGAGGGKQGGKAKKSGKGRAKPEAAPGASPAPAADAGRFLADAVKEAAHTLVHRLVLLRILEHHELLQPAVVTGGWKSPGYASEFLGYAGPLASDDARGYRDLLDVVFAELALDLPGLFGQVGVSSLLPVPTASLRAVIDVLDDPALESAWGDDTTLGWVYQYWNDPEREALDAKIAGGGKIEPHEIASKTQMFTERYMVEWLLQNSLGLTWLAICRKNGWTAEAEGVIPVLDARRAEWRARREAGEVALDALMPIAPGLESDWKYWVPQPIPEDAVARAPASIRDVKLLDPACGSGHFLVIAFGLLGSMYREEARHRGEEGAPAWSDEAIAASILANNLHGIDIDPRAVQIAAAALWLQARLFAPGAALGRMNLVAPTFRLAGLAAGDGATADPALAALIGELVPLGVPRELTLKLVESLRGVGHLGTLLRVDREIARLLDEETTAHTGPLFAHGHALRRAALETKLAGFLDAHAAEADLGLRLGAEQLAAGLRFVNLVKEGTYDVVVGNPPYQGLAKTTQFEEVVRGYPRGKADLYAAFLERGLELVREGGVSALVTMRGWMFLGQFKELREALLRTCDLHALLDLDSGAFDEVSAAQVVLSVACSVFRRAPPDALAVALRPTPTEDKASNGMTNRKRAGLLAQVGRHEFDPKGFAVIEGEPIVYWWTKEFLDRYAAAPKLGAASPAHAGLSTQDNTRFLRQAWEPARSAVTARYSRSEEVARTATWVPYIKGASGTEWIEPLQDILLWRHDALELRVWIDDYKRRIPGMYIKNESDYFRLGVAFSAIGAHFSARKHRFSSVFGHMGASLFPSPEATASTLCLLQSRRAREVMSSLNPGVHFGSSDVNRLPALSLASSQEVVAAVDAAFGAHESHREASVEFRSPGPSPWRYAQDWAQRAVDRPEGAPLPPYEPEYDDPAPEAHVSFAIGVALGRFGANNEGILDQAPDDALPAGILLVGPDDLLPDSLRHPAADRIAEAWATHGPAITDTSKTSLRDWLRKDFFAHHKAVYENRPIHFPLSSERKSFVAWTSIHRWTDQTLQILLADHLLPVLRQLEGEIADLNTARATTTDRKASVAAEKKYARVKGLVDELAAFIATVREIAERGAPPAEKGGAGRHADAPFRMDLDDGVMINGAALWPLLAPQWADPRKWWKQLCEAQGKKDYDWAHLARRYFPERVDAKCRVDPSLAVAHGCFWRYHPAKAYAWELRLQDEIREGFTIDEDGSDAARAAFLRDHPDEAAALRDKERIRRERKAARSGGDGEGGGDAAERGELDFVEDEG